MYRYVLAHQDDFDVRWCKGTIAEEIFAPWVKRMREAGGPNVVLGGRRVQTVELGEPGDRARVTVSNANGTSEVSLFLFPNVWAIRQTQTLNPKPQP